MPELSINEKIGIAFNLANKLGVLECEGKLKITEEDSDIIWVHADGLRAKYLEDRRDGRCSLQASIDFDVAAEELRLDSDIQLFEELLLNEGGLWEKVQQM